jgi:UrcA family protein
MNTVTTSIKLRGAIASAILGVLASSFAAQCIAAETGDVPQVVVHYADLNVSSPWGAAALYARIRGAADTVCPGFNLPDLASKARKKACVHKAIVDAVITVNQPALFAQYNAKNSSPLPVMIAAGQAR